MDATKDAAPEIVYLKPRVTMVPLEWPVKVDGVEYHEIGLKRMNVKEVADFFEATKDLPNGEVGRRLPIFVDATGKPISSDVLDAIDQDDFDAIDKAALDFLPRRFRSAGSASSQTSDQQSQSG